MKIRQVAAIVRATVCEVLSEPLSLLVLLAALSLTVFAPAFHYHQFGEPTRMARDAGFSSLFLGGSVIACFATIRAFRREVETGTLQMALAYPISRGGFFVAKTLGCVLAYLAFALIGFAAMMLTVWGAAIGGMIAEQTGVLARIYGPCLAGGVAMILLPLAIAAVLNRFARVRFGWSAFLSALGMSAFALLAVGCFQASLVWRYLPAAVLLAGHSVTLLAVSAAAAVRWRAHGAASAAGLVLLVSLPAVGNYYLADALSNGATVSPVYFVLALAALVPALAAALVVGVHFMNGRDVVA